MGTHLCLQGDPKSLSFTVALCDEENELQQWTFAVYTEIYNTLSGDKDVGGNVHILDIEYRHALLDHISNKSPG